MNHRLSTSAALALVFTSLPRANADELLNESFATDPVGSRALATGDASRFVHAPGQLTASIDVLDPHARLAWPLSRALNEGDSFVATVDFELRNVDFAADNFCQLSLGFINSANTGPTRTSSPGDSWELLNIDYFPGAGFPTWAPTLILQEPEGGGDALTSATLKSPFGAESLINEPGEIGSVPEGIPLTATLSYNASTHTISTSLADSSGGLAINATGTNTDGDDSTVELALGESFPFVFDAFALLQWHHFQGGSAEIIVRSIRVEAAPRDLLQLAFPDGLPEPQFGDGELSLSYIRDLSQPGFTVRAQHSLDLATWLPIDHSVISAGPGLELRRVAAPEGFLRLVVETSE